MLHSASRKKKNRRTFNSNPDATDCGASGFLPSLMIFTQAAPAPVFSHNDAEGIRIRGNFMVERF